MENAVVTQNEQENLPAVSEAAGVMNLILKAGETMDPARLSQLMDLQERILNREAKQAFNADYVRMKPHLPRVVRTKDNSQTKSKYAPLEDINDTVDPVLSQHGFATATKILSQTLDSVTVEAELLHSGGHVERTQITMPIDNKGIQGTVNKTCPHATASSITYAKRVALCALLNISTGDDKDGNRDDDDADVIDTEQAAALHTLMVESKINQVKFLETLGVNDVRKIRVTQYAHAKEILENKLASTKKKLGEGQAA